MESYYEVTKFMKQIRNIIVSLAFCTCLLCGCINQNVSDNDVTEEHISTTETTSAKKNTFYPSSTSEKERFYLHNAASDFIPFEVSFDKNYSNLSCKLYELKDGKWNNLEQVNINLSGDTFCFLVSRYLTNTEIRYKNVNPKSSPAELENGMSFQSVEPSFGSHGVMMYCDMTRAIKAESRKEFPVIANIISKNMDDSPTVDIDIFNHPENIDQKENEAYYVLTFTFYE